LRVNVINLDRSADRLAEFTAANGHLAEISRFPAVDGQRLDTTPLIERGILTSAILDHYSIGAVGCAMSHLALWDIAIESGQNLTIAEDDAIFNSEFDRRATELIETLPADWDLILWGWNFDDFACFEMLPGVSHCLGRFEIDRMRSSTRSFQDQCVSPRAFKLLWAFGITSYTISPKGARSLKGNLLPLRPIAIPHPDTNNSQQFGPMGIDMSLNSIYRHLNAFVCFPPLVITKNELAKSTIYVSEDALAKWDRALTINPYNIDALNNRAGILHTMKRSEEAIASYDRALAIEPRNPMILRNRGIVLYQQRRFEEALASNDKALAVLPRDVDTLNNRGLVLTALGRFDEAIASYDRALAIQPSHAVLQNRGDLLLRQQRFEEALATYDKALAISPYNTETLNNRGSALYALKRFEEAIASHDRVLAIDPGQVVALRSRGNALFEQGRLEEALASYEKALVTNPADADTLNNRGFVLSALMRYEEAIASYNQALAINPEHKQAVHGLAQCKSMPSPAHQDKNG
jgi:glycosyl transferase, family 25